jgi:hypothetical protein
MTLWRRTKSRYAGAIRTSKARQRFQKEMDRFAVLCKARMAERRGEPNPWSTLLDGVNAPPNLAPTITTLNFAP